MSQTRVPFPLWLGILPIWLGILSHIGIIAVERDSIQATILLAFLAIAISIYSLIVLALATNWRGMNDDLRQYVSLASDERSRDPFISAGLVSVVVLLIYLATSAFILQ